VNKGGTWAGPKGKMYCVMPGQEITPDQPVETPQTVVQQPTKLATSSMGPKQIACVNKGGTWAGPKGKMYCVMPGQTITPDQPIEVPGSTPVVLPTSPLNVEGYPKPGSFYSGPMPPAPPGGWPPFTGKAGPKQKKCTQQGGAWIGPAGKKWCQLGVGGGSVVPDQGPLDIAPPVVEQPFTSTIQCGTGYVLKGQDCYPAEGAPGAGYELIRYGTSNYYQWIYTGKGVTVDEGADWSGGGGGSGGSVPPTPDYSGGGGANIQPYPYDEGGQYDYSGGGIDYGQAPPALPGPTLEPIDELYGPVAMSAGAGIYAECDPTFNQFLPMEYPDKYGMMKVLQVFCKQAGGSAGQPGPQAPIEGEEMAQLFNTGGGY